MTDNGKIEVEVFVPPGKVALPWELWRLLGAVNLAVRRAVGDDKGFSLILSRAARDVRQVVGVDQAEEVFTSLALTMSEVAPFDDPSAGPRDTLSDADAVALLQAIRFLALAWRGSLAGDVTDCHALALGYIGGIAESAIAGNFDVSDLR